MFGNILLETAEPGTLEKIISLAKALFQQLDAIVDVGVNTVIFMYFRAFANQFNDSTNVMASARIMAFCGAVGFIVFSLGGLFDAWEKFVQPIKIRPTLDGVQRESSSQQFWSVMRWFILSVAVVWIVAHMMSRLLLPIDDIFTLLGE